MKAIPDTYSFPPQWRGFSRVLMLLVVSGGALGCSTDGPDNLTATGASNEIAITYRYIATGPVENRYRYNVWKKNRTTTGKLQTAFGKAGTTIALANEGEYVLPEGSTGNFTAAQMASFYVDEGTKPLSSYPYLVVGANQFVGPGGVIEKLTVGGSAPDADVPGSPQSKKYSFIFYGSLTSHAYGENDWLWPHVIMHELGHVRAQLRHPFETPLETHLEEHVAQTDIQFGGCAMHVILSLDETSDSKQEPSWANVKEMMGFCGQDRTPEQHQTTCIQFLKASNNAVR